MKIKLQEAYETEVYSNGDGYICLIQLSNQGERDFAILTPDQAQRLLEALPKLIETARLEALSEDENG